MNKEGVPIVTQGVINPTSIHVEVSSIPGLAQQVKDPVLQTYLLGLDLMLLWPWCKPVAAAPTGPLGLGTSICHGLWRQKKKKEEEEKEEKKKTKNKK